MSQKTLLKILAALISIALMVNLIFITYPASRDFNAKSFAKSAYEDASNYIEDSYAIAVSSVLNKKENNEIREGKEDASAVPVINNQTTIAANTSSPQSLTSSECLLKYNLTKSAIIFYNADGLHSNNMLPIVNELSYDFYWKNTTSDSEFNACFGYYESATPAFVCAGSGAKIIGETSKAALENFARAC